MNKPKIAILTLDPHELGGVLTSARHLYKFSQKYFDPTIFYLSFDPEISANIKAINFKNKIKSTTYLGMKIVGVGSRWAFWEPGHYVYSLSLWKEVLRDYDYFMMKSGPATSAYPLVQLNKKFAMWIGTSYEDDRADRIKQLPTYRKLIDFFAQFKMKKIERTILRKANYIWSISKVTKKRIDEILGYYRDNVAICGFPISVKVKEKKLAKSKKIIAVGRFDDPRKNFDMLMRSFSLIYQKLRDSKLYVVGKKPKNKILDQYSGLEFYKNIIFTGVLDDKELNQFYENSDVMLITSFQEGFGIIGLEAMSYGIPVVSTDCGGPRDYVVNNKNGFLVEINNDKKMAERTLYILNNEQLWKNFSCYALNFIKDNFSEKKFESIIKYGLIQTYPELKQHFNKFADQKYVSKVDDMKEVNL